ncbi:MAG: hypothetical protein QOD00_249 [Blastocatellia bacterium]|nr:hypothetical protein [Blastocatellia bacterium]
MLCCWQGGSIAATSRAAQVSSEPLVYASFFAPDAAATLVRADTGQDWTPLVGTWGTRRYQAYMSAPSGDGNCAATLDARIADANISVQLNDVNGGGTEGIVFRATDAHNFLFARGFNTNIQVFKKQAGALVQLASYAGGIAEGDVLAVELIGPVITVKQNGIVRLTLTESFNRTATRHGLFTDSSSASFKHFVVETGVTSATEWVRVVSPQPFQVFQRNNVGRSNIPISGTFQGSPAAIQARWRGGVWQTIAEHPSGGSFKGSLTNLNAGQGLLEVRFADNPAVFWRQRYVGIGDVYLIAGQSNAEGRITAPQFYTHATLRAGVYDQQNRWREAYDPTDASFTNQYSVWPLLATKVMGATGVPVAFITTGEGATGLVAMGAPWTRPGASYTACVASVTSSGARGLKAVLWYQGETDANSPVMTEAQYRDALKQLRANLSVSLGQPDLPLITAQLAYFHSAGSTETAASLNAVRLAQAGPPDPRIITGPILYDLDISEASGGDGQHIRSPAHARIEAARWWRVLKPLFYGGTEGLGPKVLSVKQVDPAHIDVAWNLNVGPIKLNRADGAGWRVTDDSGPLKIVRAMRRTSNTIRLALERAARGPVKVSWANYNDAVGVALTDSSADALPAEPFIDRIAQ